MPPHPLTNFDKQKYYQNESKFRGVYSSNNLPKIKDTPYEMNLDEYKSIGTHRIASYANGDNITYFDSFRVEHILKEIKKLIGKKNIITNIYRIQTNDLIMCGYFHIGVIDFMLEGKSLIDLFIPIYFLLMNMRKKQKNDIEIFSIINFL